MTKGTGKIPRERIERAARIYATNKDAAAALGIASGSFSRLCRQYGIESPQQRRERSYGHKPHGRRGQQINRRCPDCGNPIKGKGEQHTCKLPVPTEVEDEERCECGSLKAKGATFCITCQSLVQDVGGLPEVDLEDPPDLLDDAPSGSDDDRPECACGEPRDPDEERCYECDREFTL